MNTDLVGDKSNMKITKSQLKQIIKEELGRKAEPPGHMEWGPGADPDEVLLEQVKNLIEGHLDLAPMSFNDLLEQLAKLHKMATHKAEHEGLV